MQTVNPRIGQLIGRGDIAAGGGAGGPSVSFAGRSVAGTDPTYGPSLGFSGSGDVGIGQISAGLLMTLIGSWIVFYWWTHKHQG